MLRYKYRTGHLSYNADSVPCYIMLTSVPCHIMLTGVACYIMLMGVPWYIILTGVPWYMMLTGVTSVRWQLTDVIYCIVDS